MAYGMCTYTCGLWQMYLHMWLMACVATHLAYGMCTYTSSYHLVWAPQKYINIAMHYGIAFQILCEERHTSDSFKNIISLKALLSFETSTTAPFGKLATTRVVTIFRLIPFLEKR